MNSFLNKTFIILKNKYVLSLIIFICWVFVFDRNNLLERIDNIHTLKKLEKDKKYYIEKIKIDKNGLKELRTNKENLEKFAREQYLMKKKDEDIFLIEKDE